MVGDVVLVIPAGVFVGINVAVAVGNIFSVPVAVLDGT
jgi:hypothetical protein